MPNGRSQWKSVPHRSDDRCWVQGTKGMCPSEPVLCLFGPQCPGIPAPRFSASSRVGLLRKQFLRSLACSLFRKKWS